MATFITSDRHFYHKNMTEEGKGSFGIRTYKNIQEMNEDLIEAHNSVVGPMDVTIDCGDMTLGGNREDVFEIYKRMNGRFIIIKGNHDNTQLLNYMTENNYKLSNGQWKFEIHEVGYRFKQDKKIFYCTHYPLNVGDRGRTYNLHGHIHEWASQLPYGINVGIDSPDIYDENRRFGAPVPLEEAIEIVVAKGAAHGVRSPHEGLKKGEQ